jgi:hypothetical protein
MPKKKVSKIVKLKKDREIICDEICKEIDKGEIRRAVLIVQHNDDTIPVPLLLSEDTNYYEIRAMLEEAKFQLFIEEYGE